MQKRLVVISSFLLIVLLLLASGPVRTYGQAGSSTPTTTASVATTRTPAGTATRTASLNTGTPGASATPVATATTVASPTAVAQDRDFPETGFTVPAVFIKYWDAKGGLPIFGYPISTAHNEKSQTDGKEYLVQYFERNRFEYHPEFKGTSNEVLLGLLGAELNKWRTFDTVDAFKDTPSKIYMAPTKHSLSEPFLSYWNKYGGLGIFGYPISEPFTEKNATDGKNYTVQYFQRNRFEYHPENDAPYDVLLGLLGIDFKEIQAQATVWGTPIPGGIPVQQSILKAAKPANGTTKFLQGPTVGDGMIVHSYYLDANRIMDSVNDLQYSWIKQQVEWKDTENPKGTYFWGELDRIVNSAQTRGIKVMLSIVKAPDWATGGKQGFPRDPKDMGDFMTAIATHFKGRVGAYEIWNEYNLLGESGDLNPARYVELLKEAYKAVKSIDPTVVVIAGALTPTGVNDPEGKRAPGAEGAVSDLVFLEQMYQYNNGEVRAYFDVMGSHPYGFNNPPDTGWPDNPNLNPAFPYNATKKLPDYYNTNNSFYFRRIEEQRAIMEKYGDSQKQMWLTEYGWCSDYRPDGYGECRYNTEQQQADYTLQAIARAKKYYPWMGIMFLWNLNFSTFQPWYTGPSHFSILNGDFTPRPIYNALKNRTK